ncbi:MAG: hypothetical protein LBO62_06600 [Endomicrobium sp.]|jgi:hypothetical protein|nr:hypothetical protein [Endomicrobium sp.]
MKKIIALLSILALFSSEAFALFETSYWGVRALGMGGAYTAVAYGVDAAVYNIAGISEMQKPEVTFNSTKLFTGLDGFDWGTDYLAGVFPFGKKIGAVSAGWALYGNTSLRREDTFYIGYAREMDDILKKLDIDTDIVSVMLGLNLKSLMTETKKDGNTHTSSALTFDLGVLLRFKYGISIAYSGRYLTKPDLGYWEADPVKQTNVLGVSYYSKELAFLKIPEFTAALDVEMRGSERLIMIGAESKILNDKFAIRAGGWESQINFGLGYVFEIGDGKLFVDYAFGMPLEIIESTGSHFLSLTFRFP